MKMYRSRISTLLSVLLIGSLGYGLFMAIITGEWPALIVIAFTAAIIYFSLFDTRYYITEEKKLLIKVSILTLGEIDLTKATEIRSTRSILSAPACSLKRIRIDCSNGDSVVISPRYQDDFLAEVKSISPEVKIDPKLTNV